MFRQAWSGGRLWRALLFALSSVCLNALVCFGKCLVLKSTHLWIWVALQSGVTTCFLHHPLPLASACRGWSVGTLTHCPDSYHPSPADPCPTLFPQSSDSDLLHPHSPGACPHITCVSLTQASISPCIEGPFSCFILSDLAFCGFPSFCTNASL